MAAITISLWYFREFVCELEPIGPEEIFAPATEATFTETWYLTPYAFPDSRGSVQVAGVYDLAQELMSRRARQPRRDGDGRRTMRRYNDLGHTDQSSAVQAVCDWYGPSDFLRMNDVAGQMDHDAPDSPESQLVGGPIQENPHLVARANPITYVTAGVPPFSLMHGTVDDVIIPGQSELLHSALVTAGVPSTLILLGGLGHGFGGEHGRWPEIYEYVLAFLSQVAAVLY